MEECDDGNTNCGDGCSSICTIEPGWTCTGGCHASKDTCFDTCGDGFLLHRNSPGYCDDGNLYSGDGCSDDCQVESGWICAGGSAYGPDVCKSDSRLCGDGTVHPGEGCDMGMMNGKGYGCSGNCTVQHGFECMRWEGTSSSICYAVCGDSIIAGLETCDDGNIANGDG